MQWSPRFATGIVHLDEQHRMLFRMSEDYRQALDEGGGDRTYGLMLDSLADYARAHFGMEEQCMFRYQCPAAETNSAAHRHFIQALAEFRERFAHAGFRPADARALVDYVDGWLAHHIGRIDTQLKPCIDTAPGG